VCIFFELCIGEAVVFVGIWSFETKGRFSRTSDLSMCAPITGMPKIIWERKMKMLGQPTIPKRFNIASSILVLVYTLLLQAFSVGGDSGSNEEKSDPLTNAPDIVGEIQRVMSDFESVFLDGMEPVVRLQLVGSCFESIFRLAWHALTWSDVEDSGTPGQGPTDTLWRSTAQRPGLLRP
jgi:hypothetical protein